MLPKNLAWARYSWKRHGVTTMEKSNCPPAPYQLVDYKAFRTPEPSLM